jgi:hypothetical protein
VHNRHDHHLRDAVAGIQGEGRRSAIPAGHHQQVPLAALHISEKSRFRQKW